MHLCVESAYLSLDEGCPQVLGGGKYLSVFLFFSHNSVSKFGRTCQRGVCVCVCVCMCVCGVQCVFGSICLS